MNAQQYLRQIWRQWSVSDCETAPMLTPGASFPAAPSSSTHHDAQPCTAVGLVTMSSCGAPTAHGPHAGDALGSQHQDPLLLHKLVSGHKVERPSLLLAAAGDVSCEQRACGASGSCTDADATVDGMARSAQVCAGGAAEPPAEGVVAVFRGLRVRMGLASGMEPCYVSEPLHAPSGLPSAASVVVATAAFLVPGSRALAPEPIALLHTALSCTVLCFANAVGRLLSSDAPRS